jgi:hypothetical protein
MAAVKRQHPNVGFLIIASESDPSGMLEAMRAGANEFLHEPITTTALEQAISRLIAHRASPAAAGEVFAFVGAKGGVGTTTTAVNVATALAKWRRRGRFFRGPALAHGDRRFVWRASLLIIDALENIHRLDRRSSVADAATKSSTLVASSDRGRRWPTAAVPGGGAVRGPAYRHVVSTCPFRMAALDALDGRRDRRRDERGAVAVRGASRQHRCTNVMGGTRGHREPVRQAVGNQPGDIEKVSSKVTHDAGTTGCAGR